MAVSLKWTTWIRNLQDESLLYVASQFGQITIMQRLLLLLEVPDMHSQGGNIATHSRRHQEATSSQMLLSKGAVIKLKADATATPSRRHQMEATRKWSRCCSARVQMPTLKVETMATSSRQHQLKATRKCQDARRPRSGR